LIIIFCPKKKKNSTKNGDINFFKYINIKEFFEFLEINLLTFYVEKNWKKTMIPNLFNLKINNKVVEKTCLSNLKAKYHIAHCFFSQSSCVAPKVAINHNMI
jgi:hypothetical protein